MIDAPVFAALSLQIASKSSFRILPAGKFKAIDGRPSAGSWLLTAEAGMQLVQAAESSSIDYCIDYEHQSMRTEKNGLPAPAAGWFKRLEWREDGLYTVDARWTAKARAMIESGEYRFISPVFSFDKKTLEVNKLFNLALTNNPALPMLTDLAAMKARGGDADVTSKESRESLERIASRLGLDAGQLASSLAAEEEERAREMAPISAMDRKTIATKLGIPEAWLTR